MSGSDSDVLSPSDLKPGQRGPARVGGRVLQVDGEWFLADAYSRARLAKSQLPPLVEGSLVVVDCEATPSALHVKHLKQLTSPERAPLEFQRLQQNDHGQRLITRFQVLKAIRNFFETRGFIEVDTPLRTSERCLEPHIQPVPSGDSQLITSPELHMKRLLVAGIPRLFQLARCFRGSEKGRLHHPEFSMLEWYRAFSSETAVQEDTETLLRELCRQFHGSLVLPLHNGRQIDLAPPFARLTVREAFQQYADVGDAVQLAHDDENQYFQLLVDLVEPALAELSVPVFLCEYPASQAALARLKPSDPSVAERFELYVAGIELCNGYGELNDPREQRRRMSRHLDDSQAGSDQQSARLPERFLSALEEGMPPAGGNAVGLDRLVALLTGQASISDVLSFAESPP